MAALEIAHRTYEDQFSIDLSKVFAGIIRGVGFLGAGTLFRDDGLVKGAGSAASILPVGAIGIVCGVAMIRLAAVVGIAILMLLLLSRPFAKRYDPCGVPGRDE